MTNKCSFFLSLAVWMLITGSVLAQANYTLSHSSSSYQELSGATAIDAGTDWVNTKYKVPVGFSFNHKGCTADSIYVGTNGLFGFDKKGDYAFAAFLNMLVCRKDSAGNALSSISYSTSGSQGSRILKIQFKDCGMGSQSGDDRLSFQVWLYETDGKIELRMGSSVLSEGAEEPTLFIGQIDNTGKSVPMSGLTGSPSSAQLQDIDPESNPPHMTSLPAEGTIYTFNRQ